MTLYTQIEQSITYSIVVYSERCARAMISHYYSPFVFVFAKSTAGRSSHVIVVVSIVSDRRMNKQKKTIYYKPPANTFSKWDCQFFMVHRTSRNGAATYAGHSCVAHVLPNWFRIGAERQREREEKSCTKQKKKYVDRADHLTFLLSAF